MSKPFGIILCGGQSSRMGVDKGMLNYHGIPQRDYIQKLIQQFCSIVLLSTGNIEIDQENAFMDKEAFAGHGPISGILSIHDYFPDKDLLVIACDYPLLRKNCLEVLLNSNEEPLKAFKNASGYPEPLIALYSIETLKYIKLAFDKGEDSLRRIIISMNLQLIEPPDKYSILSADRPEDHLRVKEIIQSGKLNFA